MNKNKGFTLVELIYSLLITGTLILIGYGIWNQMYTKNRLNSDVDSIYSNETIAISYISSYDKKIINSMKSNGNRYYYAAPISSIQNYIPNTVLNVSHLNYLNKQAFSEACLVITRDSNESLRGYLVWNNISKANNKFYSDQNVKYLASLEYQLSRIQNNSNELDNPISSLSGAPTLNYIIKAPTSNNGGGCGFTVGVNNNSLLVNLDKNPNYKRVKDVTTDQSGSLDQNKTSDSLSSVTSDGNANQTLTSNLYFDSIVKESTPYTHYLCDVNKATALYLNSNARDTCVSYEATTGDFFVNGTQKIIGMSDIINRRCDYSVSGTFSGRVSANGINGRSNSQVDAICAPYIAEGCKYGSSGSSTPNYSVRQITCSIPPDYADELNPGRGCSVGVTYRCRLDNGNNIEYFRCKDDVNGVNELRNQGCTFVAEWRNGEEKAGVCTGYDISRGSNTLYWDDILCKIGGNSSRDGVICGKFQVDAFTDSGVAPPVHKYQALKFGDTASISSNTPSGATMNPNANIKIDNAGLKSGFIFIKSNNVMTDAPCDATELGKIVQQKGIEDKSVGAQLICMYDKDFCGGSGYCYSPLLSEVQIVKGGGATEIYCPAGTRLDNQYQLVDMGGNNLNSNCYQIIMDSNGVKELGAKWVDPNTQSQNACSGKKIREIKCVNTGSVKILNNCSSSNGVINCV